MQNKYQKLERLVANSNTLNFCSLSDSVLSSDDAITAKFHAKDMLRDKRQFWCDFTMLDTLKTCPGIDKNTIHQIHKALHTHTVTKQFLNSERTLDNLQHYGDDERPDFSWNQNFRVARSILEDQISHFHLEPIHFHPDMDISEVFTDKSTSAGAIGRGSKADNWDNIVKYAQLMLKSIRADIPFSNIWIPCIPGHRSQIKDFSVSSKFNPDYKEKDRLIWIVDASTVLIEALFAKPMIELTKTSFPGYAGGKTPVELINLINNANTLPYWYCTDYSKFDQTIPDWLIHQAFNFVRSCYSSNYKKIIDWIEYNFIHTKMLLPSGDVVEVHKGIPSGSNFTQLIGSICNYLMGLTYLSSCFNGSFDYKRNAVKLATQPVNGGPISMFVMGDDNLFFTDFKIDLHSMAQYLTHNFGVKVNADKTVHGFRSYPEFLHRTWTNAGCDRDQVDMCLNLVFSERKRDYELYSPYDILFSLYYTFPLAFHIEARDIAKWFTVKFDDAGSNAITLMNIPKSDLPGSAKVFSTEVRQEYARNFLHLAKIK